METFSCTEVAKCQQKQNHGNRAIHPLREKTSSTVLYEHKRTTRSNKSRASLQPISPFQPYSLMYSFLPPFRSGFNSSSKILQALVGNISLNDHTVCGPERVERTGTTFVGECLEFSMTTEDGKKINLLPRASGSR